MDPNLVSLAAALSAQPIAGFQHAFAEVRRQRGVQADPLPPPTPLPKRLPGKQTQKVRQRMTIRTRTVKRLVRRNKGHDERRDLGYMKEKSCLQQHQSENGDCDDHQRTDAALEGRKRKQIKVRRNDDAQES